jgi:hypothetical protein
MTILPPDFYFNRLYPLQDQVLRLFGQVETGFYLTGGTALSRGYLNHRFSDDLDLFVDDREEFGLWADRLVTAVRRQEGFHVQVIQREQRYVRLNLSVSGLDLKIELINDVPSRVGVPWQHPVLGRLDTAENILANKVTALIDRSAPKDLADIWGLCCGMGLSLQQALDDASGKAAGIFPADLARALISVSEADWRLVRWIDPPDLARFTGQLKSLGQSLILP